MITCFKECVILASSSSTEAAAGGTAVVGTAVVGIPYVLNSGPTGSEGRGGQAEILPAYPNFT